MSKIKEMVVISPKRYDGLIRATEDLALERDHWKDKYYDLCNAVRKLIHDEMAYSYKNYGEVFECDKQKYAELIHLAGYEFAEYEKKELLAEYKEKKEAKENEQHTV